MAIVGFIGKCHDFSHCTTSVKVVPTLAVGTQRIDCHRKIGHYLKLSC